MNIYWVFYWDYYGYTNDLIEAYDMAEVVWYYEDTLGYEIDKVYLWK